MVARDTGLADCQAVLRRRPTAELEAAGEHPDLVVVALVAPDDLDVWGQQE